VHEPGTVLGVPQCTSKRHTYLLVLGEAACRLHPLSMPAAKVAVLTEAAPKLQYAAWSIPARVSSETAGLGFAGLIIPIVSTGPEIWRVIFFRWLMARSTAARSRLTL
jgi:hypothetical protein